MRRAGLVLLILLAPALSACGQASPDLFEVLRSGQGRNAKLDMVVNDGGEVTCNGKPYPLNGDLLLRARELARDLVKPANLRLRLPPGRGGVLDYRVRLEQGTVTFSDTSPHQPPAFLAVQKLTKDISEDVCRLAR